MKPQLEVRGANIVVRGDLNPAIFQPAWFSKNDLIKAQEAEAANVTIICPDAAIFDAGWLQVQVVRDRLQVGTAHESQFEAVRDLVRGVFNLLYHTPLRAVGLNWDFHYRMSTADAWNLVGDVLAPKEPWKDILKSPGMSAVVMRDQRPDEYKGYLVVRVEPSVRTQYGVYVNINDHFEAREGSGGVSDAERVLDILETQWDISMERGSRIAEKVVAIGEHQ